MLFLLKEAKRRDNLYKRRQGERIRNLGLLNTNKVYIRTFRLTKNLIEKLELDLIPLMPKQILRRGLTNHPKVT